MPKSIPQYLHKFFWDVNASAIQPNNSTKYVITRLLDKGDAKAASWVLHNYSSQDIKDTFSTMRDFSPQTANFWSQYLSIPKEQILCLQKPYRHLRKTHWPY